MTTCGFTDTLTSQTVEVIVNCVGVTGSDIRTECAPFTWIDGITYTVSNDTATYNVIGGAANGCDSLVTLDLTINNVSNLTTTTSGITINAANSNASYQWLDCDNGYGVISGETGQSYTPLANGNYAVELTENGCVDTSVCVAISSVGIVENGFDKKLSVFPNPSIGNFSIELDKIYNAISLRLTDLNGRLIVSNEYHNTQMINLAIDKPAGIYLLIIESGNNKAIVRLAID